MIRQGARSLLDKPTNSPRERLILFTRYPVPGRTKTRVIPALGPAGAAELQRYLTERTFKKAAVSAAERRAELRVCYRGGDGKRMRRWLGSGASFSRQRPGNLGEGMEGAFSEAFEKGCRPVVLAGTDVPDVESHHFAQAFDVLREKDLVLGPSTDGGYWLIGLKEPAPVFRNIPWGSPVVLAQTLSAAEDLGFSVHCLPAETDIDTPEDVNRCLPEWKRPYLSVVIPTLNEVETLETTIYRTRNPDNEIIVADGGSHDGTAGKARHTGARVVISPPGRALQQNLGAAEAEGRVLLFLHADTRLPRDYVSVIFESLLDPAVLLGAFRFETDLRTPVMRLTQILTNLRSHLFSLPYGDQGLFIRKSVFFGLGGFPQVPVAEDLLFVRRVSKAGRISTAPAPAVTSSRRWRTQGTIRTFLIHQTVLFGFALGISPRILASLRNRTR